MTGSLGACHAAAHYLLRSEVDDAQQKAVKLGERRHGSPSRLARPVTRRPLGNPVESRPAEG